MSTGWARTECRKPCDRISVCSVCLMCWNAGKDYRGARKKGRWKLTMKKKAVSLNYEVRKAELEESWGRGLKGAGGGGISAEQGQRWSGKKFGVLSSQERARRVPGGWCLGCRCCEPELRLCPLVSALSVPGQRCKRPGVERGHPEQPLSRAVSPAFWHLPFQTLQVIWRPYTFYLDLTWGFFTHTFV